MSKTKLFTIYDSKTEVFNLPMHLLSTGEAIRTFTEWANDPKSQICKYPADFTLFEIGEYDNATGRFYESETKKNLGLAIEFQTLIKHVPEITQE